MPVPVPFVAPGVAVEPTLGVLGLVLVFVPNTPVARLEGVELASEGALWLGVAAIPGAEGGIAPNVWFALPFWA